MGIIEIVLGNPVLFVVPFYINLQKWVEAISVSNLTPERRVDYIFSIAILFILTKEESFM